MSDNQAPTDPEIRVSRVIDYILNHPEQDLSREVLARVAHYSPEHLPKLFKQLVGETPKQYSLRLRLETAFHWLIIHPDDSVAAIGLDNGFTSLSAFSRSFKNYFSHSPEEIRRLPHAQQMRLLHGPSAASSPASTTSQPAPPPEICVVRQPAIEGVYIPAPFDAPDKIREAFKTLSRFSCDNRAFTGILTPHLRNTYRAFLAVGAGQAANWPYPATRIGGGTYARFSVEGDLRSVNKAAHYFYRRWLPANGYKISGIVGFETFDQHPGTCSYTGLCRHIHIPIERAR